MTQNRPWFRAPAVCVVAAVVAGLVGPRAWAGDTRWHEQCACLEHRLEALRRLTGDRSGHFDPVTGRDTRNYPPHAPVDIEALELDLDIPDMNQTRLTGVATYQVAARAASGSLWLRAGPRESMKVTAVSLDGDATAARFEHEGERLTITFSKPLEQGSRSRLSIAYTLSAPSEGLVWTPENPAWPGRPAQLHTQGQPESNHYWFPCHDFPNERMAQTVRVAVPLGFFASSNGTLTGRQTVRDREVFQWTLPKGHVSYLTSLVVGKFDRVDLAPVAAGPGGEAVPLEVYAPLGSGHLVQQTFGRTGAMTSLFADFTRTPYPWGRYAQLVVHNFGAGGMENTSATTLYDTAVLDQTALLDGDLDGLISHELAHQWFGDLVTCNSWEHIWLNEGFATYFTHLWFQHRDGDEAYLAALFNTRAGLVTSDPSDPAPAPLRPGMCSKEYAHPWEVFRRGANPYPKGAFILHMLRERLGDGPFRAGIADYLAKRSFQTAETSDLRAAFERASGDRLEGFFDQWCFRPGVPIVRVSSQWDKAARTLTIRASQAQPIDGYNPAFDLAFPVSVAFQPSGSPPPPPQWRSLSVRVDGRDGEATLVLASPADAGLSPLFVAVDPRAAVLADLRVEQPLDAWVQQLTQGPTIVSRLQAAAALGEVRDMKVSAAAPGTSAASAALLAVARSATAAVPLRVGAINALAARKDSASLLELATLGAAEAPVRTAIVQGLGAIAHSTEASRQSAARVARQWLAGDPSYGVRAASARALGSLSPQDAATDLLAACNVPSQHDQIRVAAIETLAKLQDPRGLDAVIAAAAPGMPARTRPAAIKAAGALLRQDPARVWALLAGALEDSQDRTRRAAAEALAATGDPRAKPLLESRLSSLSEAERASARGWLAAWAEANSRREASAPEAPAAREPATAPPAPRPSRRSQGFTGGQPVAPR